jgi:uncharacterized protein (TIGR00255 family)
LRSECTKLIERGKVNILASAEYTDNTARASSINSDLLKKYYSQLKEIAEQLGDNQASLFELALNMPEVISTNEEEIDEEEGNIFLTAFQHAVEKFNIFRMDEGIVLKNDLENRAKLILAYLDEVISIESDRVPLIRERIAHYLDETVGKENVDMNRFEQELIYYIDKLDITEEKVRLKSHCDYFLKALNASDSNGKKLGFISQEMGREINTLGSKANHAGIQQIVIRMKEELEKIKEQLLNVL